MASGQRNMAAAFVVATGSLTDRPEVVVLLAAAGLIGMIFVMPIAGWFGRRAERTPVLAGVEVVDAEVRRSS
jgi:hypothetical protein